MKKHKEVTMKKYLVLLLALGVLYTGCAKRAVTTQPEQPAQETQKAAKAETAKPAQEDMAKIESKDVKTEAQKIESTPAEKPSALENIYFDYDKYDIRNDEKPALKSAYDRLLKNKSMKMLIEGHCDDRGTNEYNLALGERRAKSARDYLVSLGVAKNRLDIISFGEEKPVCTEQTEDCWQKNRRAKFVAK